jgi:hypothetical protein
VAESQASHKRAYYLALQATTSADANVAAHFRYKECGVVRLLFVAVIEKDRVTFHPECSASNDDEEWKTLLANSRGGVMSGFFLASS